MSLQEYGLDLRTGRKQWLEKYGAEAGSFTKTGTLKKRRDRSSITDG
jgi:hypothetical protein